MSRLLTTVHGRFNAIGVGTSVTPGGGGGPGGGIEEPFPPGVYASDGSANAGLSRIVDTLYGVTNPVSFTLSCWVARLGTGTQVLFRINDEGSPISFACNVSSTNGSISINLKDSGLTTRFTLAQASLLGLGWNHVALSVKIDEATVSAGVSLWINDSQVDVTSGSTWSVGSNIGMGLTGYLFWIFNELAANDATATSDGCLGPYWLDLGRFTDFSVEATRRKFISSLGRPVGLGVYGETPFGLRPTIYIDGPFDELTLNRGTGNDLRYVDRDGGVYDNNVWTECADNAATGALAF